MKFFKNKITRRFYAISDQKYNEAISNKKPEATFTCLFDSYRYIIPFDDMDAANEKDALASMDPKNVFVIDSLEVVSHEGVTFV